MIYFIVPVYNEAENIGRLINETISLMDETDYQYKLILVNDGSTDNSLEIIENMQTQYPVITALSHFPNKGVRQTFLEGFQHFLSQAKEGDIAVTKEADNTSDNSLTTEMISAITEDNFDIALASCYMPNGGFERTNLFRKTLSFFANALIKTRFSLWHLHTFSSFYRAFSYNALAIAFGKYGAEIMTQDGFSCVVEMLIKMNRLNLRIKEIPMILKSQERQGKSKMPIMKTIIGYFKLCLHRF